MTCKLRFLRVLNLICKILLKINYFAADKDKSLICRVFVEVEVAFSACMHMHKVIKNIFKLCFTQFFNKSFNKSYGTRCKSDVFSVR